MAKLFEVFGNIAIQNQEAIKAIDNTIQKANELKNALGIQVEKLEDTADGMEDVGKSADNTGNKFNSFAVLLGNSMTRVINWFGRMGKAAVTTGFEFNASIESYQKQFAVLLQDEEKAKKLVDELRELAKITPLGMEGLANNAVLLLNTGIKLENIIPTLEMIGNLSLGDQNKMNSVVRAYTQIMAKGNLLAQEMYQLGDAGVPFKLIMTEFGGEKYKDGKWWESKMSDPTYKIPFEDVQKAFMAATAEGGIWHDYMFAMMETWAGQMDRLKEEGKELLGDFTEPFFEVAKSDVMPKLVESFDRFSVFLAENKDTVTEWAKSLGNLTVEAFDGLITLFEWLIKNKDAVATAFQVIGGAITLHFAAAHPYLTAIVAAVTALQQLTKYTDERAARENQQYNEAASEIGNGIDLGDVMEKHPDYTGGIIEGYGGLNKYDIAFMIDKEAAAAIGYPVPDYNPNGIPKWNGLIWERDGTDEQYHIDGKEQIDAWWQSLPVDAGNVTMWANRIKILTDAALSTEEKIKRLQQEDDYEKFITTPLQPDPPSTNPYYIQRYKDVYGDDWFNHWYEENIDRTSQDDLNYVIDKYDVQTLGSLPIFNNLANSLMMGSNTAFGGLGVNTTTMVALLNNLNAKLDTVINYQAQGKTIVLNTGALVGGIGGAMDQQLGRMFTQKTRG